MRKLFITTSFALLVAFGGISASAQCNPSVESPIKCSYYNEGYQDGVNDAQGNRNSDYTRYKRKYERKYEVIYSQGYTAGYNSIRQAGGGTWTRQQRTSYDLGYNQGDKDKRSGGINRSQERTAAQYDPELGRYYQQGYFDSFYNRGRQYDVPLSGTYPPQNPQYPPQNPQYPPRDPQYPPNNGGGWNGGGTTGLATWSGRVDDRVNIILQGNSLTIQDVSGNGAQTTYQNVSGMLPRRSTTVTAQRREGRGSVTVIQQPDRSNNFTAIIQVSDPKGGADNYKVDISWVGNQSNVEEPYQSGSVTWRGRVDQTANIIIYGADVQTQDASGTGLSGVDFRINGSLARRPGSVTARKKNGRGTVTVLQNPTRDNDYTAIVQVFDPSGGSDNYEVEITW